MELQPVEDDPVQVSERKSTAAQGPKLVQAGMIVILMAPFIMVLGAAGLFGVIPPLSGFPIPHVLIGVGCMDLLMGGFLVALGKKRSAQA
jgi:hypothetical protein